jgi:small subunit ribosomal protein S11
LKNVSIIVSGPGAGRESAIRAVHSLNINIFKLKDSTKVAHGGCRRKKPRRV